jgi:hypothetical protein
MVAAFGLLGLVAAYDFLTTGKMHRATALGAAWVVFIELTAIVVGPTAAWHSFAAYL